METSADANVRLYERCGFAVFATTQINDGPVVYSMATKMFADRRTATKWSLGLMFWFCEEKMNEKDESLA